ncbi:hypothetical protein BGV54_20250 [Burkholderia ubonensis]|uniref:hypothetical protein n=1 Tax=Burkholderia ubonensis TaxID=101571 RepID=UPI0008FDD39E|nr:hypothetical protein [Burkholderia ubonensis]OJB18807.1 hypothetical protein BGV54_20250 [Burkholderia ubonensis]
MKAVLNTTDAGVLLPRIDAALTTPWTFVAVDTADRAGFAAAVQAADAAISMRWDESLAPAPRLKLLQLPGAGTDRIDFAAL